MSDIRHIHEGIIDNPDFNLTAAAKRDLRELCAWVEEYRKHGQEVLDVSKNRIAELERADIEAGAWITEWMLADKYRKPDIPAVVRQARKAYQQTMAENERLTAVFKRLEERLKYIDPVALDIAREALAAIDGDKE